LIGHKFSTPAVQADVKNLPFRVVGDKDDNPKIDMEIEPGEGNIQYPPEKISALVLKKIKEIAEMKLDEG